MNNFAVDYWRSIIFASDFINQKRKTNNLNYGNN